jgi:cysteine sulfinate desulfinase/cysteine desulfurase-like protein
MLKDLLEEMESYSFSSGCSCLGQEHSNVIEAIDPNGNLPSCTIRISFSDRTDAGGLVEFAQKLAEAVARLRGEKTVGPGCQSRSRQADADLNAVLGSIKKDPH